MGRWFILLVAILVVGCTPGVPVGTPTPQAYPYPLSSPVVVMQSVDLSPAAARLTPVAIKLTLGEIAVASCPKNLFVTPLPPSQAVLICTQPTPTGVVSVTSTASPTLAATASPHSTITTSPTGLASTPTNTAVLSSTPTSTAVITPTPTVTVTVAAPPSVTVTMMPMPTGTVVAGHANSNQMGLWVPTAFDTCPSYPSSVTTDAQKITYIEGIHDSYKVVGPDGLWYPTWHPPVDPATGCKFGHEHGDDPSKSAIWTTTKAHYAWADPATGQSDLADAGVPFGYVNVQMDTWTMANGSSMIPMRHEDHVGHKVSFGNNLQIGLNHVVDGTQFFYPGVTCSFLSEFHQGTYSKDALENNLHEVLYSVTCSDGHQLNLDEMGKFGAPGQFTRLCDIDGDRATIIHTGFDYANANYPADTQGGMRLITTRDCVTHSFLVPSGQFSANAYEAWPVSLVLKKSNGSDIATSLALLQDVEDSARYYNPGHVDPISGLVDNVGHMQDLCYEVIGGNRARGGPCDGMPAGVSWDDPRAAFRGLSRGVYMKAGTFFNAAGPTTWYSDPFGENAQTTPFPGSVKQFVTKDTIDYAASQNAFVTGTVFNEVHDDGHGSVHAPN